MGKGGVRLLDELKKNLDGFRVTREVNRKGGGSL